MGLNKLHNSENNHYIAALFFIFLQIIVLMVNIPAGRFSIFFWFCNHTPIIFAFAFFYKRINIVKAIINIGFLAQFIWIYDFFFKIITGEYFLGITRYVFEDISELPILIPILIHLFGTTVAFYLTRKEKPTSRTLGYSFIYLLALYLITLKFSPPAENINCIYWACGFEDYSFKIYQILWPLIAFLILALPTHAIQWIVYKLYNLKKKSQQ